MSALVSRRAFLRASVMASVAIASGAAVWLREAAAGFRVLAPQEVRIVEALGEALYPEGNPIGLSWRDVDIARCVDDLLTDLMLPRNVPAIRYLLRTLEIATLVARGQSFTSCPVELRVQIFEIWSQQDPFPRRLMIDSLKGVLCMAYYDNPRVKAAIGWRTGCDG